LGVPLCKWIIKLGKLTVGIGEKDKMRLDLNDIPTVLISLPGYGLAHANDAFKNPLDHGATVPTGRSRRRGCSGHVIMARSCTRGANILATLWWLLGSITEVTKRLMNNIFGIANIGDPLNHVHYVGGIGKILHGIIHGPSQLIPNKAKYAKTFLIWCHPIQEIGSTVPQSGSISLLGINGGTKELVEVVVVVWIELICLALYSQITVRKHESELLGLVLGLIVNGGALFILRTKSQELEKVI
jgi:hypothetical protein